MVLHREKAKTSQERQLGQRHLRFYPRSNAYHNPSRLPSRHPCQRGSRLGLDYVNDNDNENDNEDENEKDLDRRCAPKTGARGLYLAFLMWFFISIENQSSEIKTRNQNALILINIAIVHRKDCQ